MYIGTLFIISAPSGAGKSSLIKAVLKKKYFKKIYLSISFTTRIIRPGEFHGKDYYFISKKKFKIMKNKGEFLEYEKIFNNYYGISNKKIYKMLYSGNDVLLNINWKGAKKICNFFLKVKTILILPPSYNELNKRLNLRATDTKEVIKKRIKISILEIKNYKYYDYLIINDDFYQSIKHLYSIILSEQLLLKNQKRKFKSLLNILNISNIHYV